MNRIPALTLFALTALVTAGSVSAQEHAVKANVPFDFTVNHKLLPPGEYKIEQTAPNVIAISNAEKGITVVSLTLADDRPKGAKAELVFNRYGNQYFLSKVVTDSASKSMDIPTSKLEKRVRWQVGRLRDAGDQTFVALK